MLVLGGVAALFIFEKNDAALFDTIVAGRTDIVEEVASTGRVKPTETIELSFESGGRIKSIAKSVGSNVSRGEVLLTLGNSELYAQKAQADARVAAAHSLLEELKQGVRPEELELKKVALQNAEEARSRSEAHVEDVLRDTYIKADDAVRNKADQLFSNPRTTDPVLTAVVQNNLFRNQIEQKRVNVEESLKRAEMAIHSSNSIVEKRAAVKKMLTDAEVLLDRIAFAINNEVSPNSAVSQMTIDMWRSDIAAARGSVSSAENSITGAEQNISSAEAALRLAKSDIVLAEAGTDKNRIRAQQANVEGAQAEVSGLLSQIEKSVVRAPISGVISKQERKVGESVSAFSPAVTIISAGEFEVETFVPEADISLVRVGLPVKITLDAYTSEDIFPAKVARIDPAETLIEGVATYKVVLVFNEKDERIRSGMTANSTIESDKRENVLALPLRAVITKEGKEFVRIAHGETYEEVPVTTGLRGSNGMVEITSGLKEGDEVVLFVKDESHSL